MRRQEGHSAPDDCPPWSAAWARGENPGEWVSQGERRPDLRAEGQVIVSEIVAELDGRRRPAARLALVE